jgi:TATA-box binding protein (TBP) (component of TFIID and TFIIIB)
MFPAFEDLKITTQTYVVHTTLSIPLDNFYDSVNCVPIRQPYKKKMDVSQETLNDGDIVYIQFKKQSKGVKKDISDKQMLNVVTIIVKLGTKLYNVKVAQSGKIHLTGCRSLSTVLFIVNTVFRLLNITSAVECFVICVMSNVNIEIPFKINRDKLHQFINQETEHISILEKSVGYVGVNVKIKSEQERKEDTTISKVTLEPDGSHVIERASFSDYLTQCERANKKYKREMYNSFLIFESGKTIMSGCSSYVNRKAAYETFTRIIEGARAQIAL